MSGAKRSICGKYRSRESVAEAAMNDVVGATGVEGSDCIQRVIEIWQVRW